MIDSAKREQAAQLYAAYLKAKKEYEDFGVDIYGYDDDQGEGATRCMITKQVVLSDDEFFEDCETGEVVLRSALNLPPREGQ